MASGSLGTNCSVLKVDAPVPAGSPRTPHPMRSVASVARLASALVAVAVAVGGATAPSIACAESYTFPIADLFSTGVDSNRELLEPGQSDPHYSITNVVFWTQSELPQYPFPADYPPPSNTPWLGAPNAYRIDQWAPNNISGTVASQWVAPNNSIEALPPFTPSGQLVEAPVAKYYAYQTTFTIPDNEWEFAEFSGTWVADNIGTGILLNGTRIDATNSFTYSGNNGSSLFKTGLNTLEFRVRNVIDPNNAADFVNPTGLQVAITGAYYISPVPEPSVAVLGAMGVATVLGFKTPSLRRRVGRSRSGFAVRRGPQRRAGQRWTNVLWSRSAEAADDGADRGSAGISPVGATSSRITRWKSSSAPGASSRRTAWGLQSRERSPIA